MASGRACPPLPTTPPHTPHNSKEPTGGLSVEHRPAKAPCVTPGTRSPDEGGRAARSAQHVNSSHGQRSLRTPRSAAARVRCPKCYEWSTASVLLRFASSALPCGLPATRGAPDPARARHMPNKNKCVCHAPCCGSLRAAWPVPPPAGATVHSTKRYSLRLRGAAVLRGDTLRVRCVSRRPPPGLPQRRVRWAAKPPTALRLTPQRGVNNTPPAPTGETSNGADQGKSKSTPRAPRRRDQRRSRQPKPQEVDRNTKTPAQPTK
jgi:hypothetical protein